MLIKDSLEGRVRARQLPEFVVFLLVPEQTNLSSVFPLEAATFMEEANLPSCQCSFVKTLSDLSVCSQICLHKPALDCRIEMY